MQREPVGHHVVGAQQQRDSSDRLTRELEVRVDHVEVPERMRRVERAGQELADEAAQLFGPGRRIEGHDTGVAGDVDVLVVDPAGGRQVAADRRDPLAEPGQRGESSGDVLAQLGDPQPAATVAQRLRLEPAERPDLQLGARRFGVQEGGILRAERLAGRPRRGG